MFSYYLQDRAYYNATPRDVKAHIDELNAIVTHADEYDHFLKYKMFFDCPFNRKDSIRDYLFGAGVNSYIQNRVLPSILRRVKDLDRGYMGLKEMDEEQIKTVNAFLGPKFSTLSERLLTKQDDYFVFRSYYSTHNVNAKNFGKCCRIALKHVVLLDKAIEDVLPIGKEAAQVFDDLLALDQYVENYWKSGPFDVTDAQAKTNVVISNESKTTQSNPKLSRTRLYSIPGIGSKYCFIHIKLGNGKRIHIYPDETTHRVFIPYIGAHKKTKKNS